MSVYKKRFDLNCKNRRYSLGKNIFNEDLNDKTVIYIKTRGKLFDSQRNLCESLMKEEEWLSERMY